MLVSLCDFLISVLMTFLCTVTAPLNIWTRTDYTPIDKDNCKLSFATMSDVHMDSSILRKLNLELGIKDLNDSQYKLDALVFTGDFTDHGYLEHYKALKEVMSKYTPAKNIIMTMGNHDTWTEKMGRILADKYFYEFQKEITGRDLDNYYYSTTVNGYHFICICSESYTTDGYISEKQIEWLDKELEKASKDNLPIFVFSHWPISQTHSLPEVDGETNPLSGSLGINRQG